MKTVIEPEKKLNVAKDYDTVVCGGGIAGIAAALASARHGAKTLLIEREFLLGGLATVGLIAIYLPLCDGCGHQVSFGIAEELLRLSVKHGTDLNYGMPEAWFDPNGSVEDRTKKRFRTDYNPQIYACDLEAALNEAGVDLLYGTVVANTLVSDGKITHLVLENKSGRSAVAVKTVVDATGDADIVHQSGENEALYGPGNKLAGWYYSLTDGKPAIHMLGAKDLADDEYGDEETPLVDRRFGSIDADELTEQVQLSHKVSSSHFFENGELSEHYSMITLPTIPQVRMTRRIDGDSVLEYEDMHKEFPDSVGLFGNWKKRGPVYELRFSALHGSKVRNLICAGRNISSTDDMWEITRVIPVCAVSGQAAGTAAAMYHDFTEVNVSILQDTLKKDGVVLHESEL